MKPILRTKLVVAIVGCMSLAMFAIVVSSRTARTQKSSLRSQGSTRRLRSNRHSEEQAPPGLEKTFGLSNNTPVDFLVTAQDQSTPAQQSKISPDVVALVGPVSQDKDLRDLPYIPPTEQEGEEVRLRRYPPKSGTKPSPQDPIRPSRESEAQTNMAGPTQTFAGMTQNLACGSCVPPDTDGDVGPNHYLQAVNSSIRVHDKSGNVLAGPITYNSFFSALGTSTPCGNNQNQGDGIAFYDHMADRWVISDFAFPAFPGTSFYQCIGVSKTSNPVAGGYWLYAVQVDPANNNFMGDYPKFGLWPDAYYLSMNEFTDKTPSGFQGVRVYALDRNSMVNGG